MRTVRTTVRPCAAHLMALWHQLSRIHYRDRDCSAMCSCHQARARAALETLDGDGATLLLPGVCSEERDPRCSLGSIAFESAFTLTVAPAHAPACNRPDADLEPWSARLRSNLLPGGKTQSAIAPSPRTLLRRLRSTWDFETMLLA